MPIRETPLDERGWEDEIYDLLVSYAVQYDARDIEGIVNNFSPNASYVSYLGKFSGEIEIRQNFEELLAKFERSMHFITNLTLRKISSSLVGAASYMQAFVVPKDGPAYCLGGLYHDRIEKHGSEWKIQERTVTDGLVFRLELMEPESRLRH